MWTLGAHDRSGVARRAEFGEFKRKGQQGHILEQLDSGGGVAACRTMRVARRRPARRDGAQDGTGGQKGGGVRLGGAGIAGVP